MSSMDSIVAGRERVLIHQIKEWGEIFLGFESTNRYELRDEAGQNIGYVAEEARGIGQWLLRKWAWFHRVFAIENVSGMEMMELRSPFLHPWTFTLTINGGEAGVIRKKWGGLLKEMFTDADVFGVEMRGDIPVEVRKLLLGATFLVDFTCFENNQRH